MYVAVRRLPRSDNHSAAATALRRKRVCPHLRKQGVKYRLFSGEEKRSKKVAGDYYRDCVPDLKPRVAIINCSPLCLHSVHRTVCGARRARNAFLVREDANVCPYSKNYVG